MNKCLYINTYIYIYIFGIKGVVEGLGFRVCGLGCCMYDWFRCTYSSDLRRVKKESEDLFEKEKKEMIDKLKDLGNFVLGKVGLSLDNFKVEQNPETGSYNIQFQQNPKP